MSHGAASSAGVVSFRALSDALAGVSVGGAAPSDSDRVRARAAQLAWSCTVEPGDATAGALIAALGPVGALEAVSSGDLRRRAAARRGSDDISLSELSSALERWRNRLSLSRTLSILRASERLGVLAILPGDPEWPSQLDDLGPHAPCALWVRGRVPALGELAPSVALVGARASTSYGEDVTMRLGSGLANRGCAIVSGGAYGIDAVAHRVALAEGGTTVAVLAGGADRLYPQGNRSLLERVLATGALVSELPVGQAPTRWRFLQRNRLIAALAGATVVVEAGRRSGAANTAAHALTLGRPLGVVPGPVTSAASIGCHRLLRESEASLITGVEDVLELLIGRSGEASELGAPGASSPLEGADAMAPRLSSNAVRAKDALRVGRAQRIDAVAAEAGLSSAETSAGLAELELSGFARETPIGWVRISARQR